ncbi:hypothetical protein B0H67DRAFT_554220 [Lasiosphaeris hirsuta]|uniref:SigF-like NTF2-like domain-containing protein n=1 Tax=Lasiosphaeris hirsuta TaxID=260670 RepID=A0AA40DU81_9PEZI|nr:hypothetical protein B0H67DRAFT_554220 [Lasiosphaeris hirsuta]
MEHPVKDIRGVIRSLCQGGFEEQQEAVLKYFTPSASLVHPYCRVPSFEAVRIPGLGDVDSRTLVLAIYRWFFDQRANLLYVTLTQTFSIWLIPFHKAPVRLVTVLHLVPDQPPSTSAKAANHNLLTNTGNGHTTLPDGGVHLLPNQPETPLSKADDEPSFAEVASTVVATPNAAEKSKERRVNHTTVTTQSRSSSASGTSGGGGGGGGGRTSTRYRIQRQEDLYQVNDSLRFLFMAPGAAVYACWQLFSTFMCLLGVVFLGPVVRMLAGLDARWHAVDAQWHAVDAQQARPRLNGGAGGGRQR